MTRYSKLLAATLAIGLWVFAALPGAQAGESAAVNVLLKNNADSTVDVELIDQYGGNFTASITGGMSQNQSLRAGSEIKVGGATVHVVAVGDEGSEIVIAEP